MTSHKNWIMTGHYPKYALGKINAWSTCTLSTNHSIRIHVIGAGSGGGGWGGGAAKRIFAAPLPLQPPPPPKKAVKE